MMEISTFKTPSYEIRLEINRLEGKLAKAKYHRLSSILYLTLKIWIVLPQNIDDCISVFQTSTLTNYEKQMHLKSDSFQQQLLLLCFLCISARPSCVTIERGLRSLYVTSYSCFYISEIFSFSWNGWHRLDILVLVTHIMCATTSHKNSETTLWNTIY